MNERIQELDKQAKLWAMDNTNFPISSHIPAGYTEKFAELLIEECIGQCWTVSELESNGYVVSECSKKIRKHFGIEQ